MTYRQARAFLSKLSGEGRMRADALKLDRTQVLLELIGNPHRCYPIVHVAGSSGKGSTVAMIASILQAAGYRVGIHFSPSLQTPRERAQINFNLIPKQSFAAIIKQLKPLFPKVVRITKSGEPTYFETLGVLAFQYFANQKIDVAVVETGLGGRLDATNVIEPVLTVITSVDYDHTDILGKTLAKIAREKAGIIKQGIPVVAGRVEPKSLAVIRKVAKSKHATVHIVKRPLNIKLKMFGAHQKQNAAIAKKCAEILRKNGFTISDRSITRGLRHAFIPGRFEIIQRNPTVILDGAHNPAKMRSTANAIRSLTKPNQKVIAVIGTKSSKDAGSIMREIKPTIDTAVLTRPHYEDHRFFEPQELARYFRGKPLIKFPRATDAVKQALKLAGKQDTVLVTGSLYLIGEVRKLWPKLAVKD